MTNGCREKGLLKTLLCTLYIYICMHMYTYIHIYVHTHTYIMTIAIRASPEIFQSRRLCPNLFLQLCLFPSAVISGERNIGILGEQKAVFPHSSSLSQI